MPPPIKTFGERIADVLVEDGLLFRKQFEELLEQQKREGTRLLKIILDKAYVTEQDMAVSMGRVLNTPPINLGRLVIAPEVADLLPKDICHSHKVVPVSRLENKLFLAMADPLNVLAIDDVKRITRLEVAPLIASEKAILDKLNNIDASKSGSMEDIIQDAQKQADLEAEAESLELTKEPTDDISLDQLAASTEEGPVIKLANLILLQAIKDRASDIHIEPFEKEFRIRFRVDGVLFNQEMPPRELKAAIISRLKLMAKLNIAERRLPQDGRIKLKILGREVDLRVSTLPTLFGESLVMRLLDRSTGEFYDLRRLGFDNHMLARMEHYTELPHGIFLVTGPTGSGKSTTLYSALKRINIPDKKIITIEDPVEYQMDGINQIHVNPAIGLTFASGLRHIVRQDPDVIMVGEIRDRETADIAIRAALTGHFVYSTLHTNDAPSAITRLTDMGVEGYLITSSLVGVLAQRLVRVICRHCKVSAGTAITPDGESIETFRGAGCEQCSGSGYTGRLGIFELMDLNDEIRKRIMSNEDASQITAAARRNGMRNLREDGWMKVQDGLTTVQELMRVTQEF